MQNTFNTSVHPRDEYGRFAEKGVMELSAKERKKLLDYLENEEYENYNMEIVNPKLKPVKYLQNKVLMSICLMKTM